MSASMHDVGNVIKRMESVRNRVAAERSRQAGEDISVLRLREIQRGTILGYTMDILERHKLGQSPTVEVAPFIIGPSSTEVVPFDARVKQPAMVMIRSKPTFGARKGFSSANADVTSLEVNYALNVRKVLYITEFVILINYVEVIVPIIFSANLLVMYHLPNRVYYSQIARMDDEKLRKTIENVTLYCVLQLVSLVILFLVLWRRLRISGLRQLAFVLEKQGETGTDQAYFMGILQRSGDTATLRIGLHVQVRVA
ncbi:hypothetical protein PI124_g12712 [Phytophthora idaei]|nr:hypothetical protein PI124_g12712 [Phytophthora idaei]